MPQPEAIEKQVHWGENVKLAIKPQLASGVAGTAGLFGVSCTAFCGGVMDSVQGHLRQSVLNERVREFSTAARRCTCAVGTFRMYIAEMPLNECEGAIPINRSTYAEAVPEQNHHPTQKASVSNIPAVRGKSLV